MPLAGIKGSDRLLSKVELFPRRNSVVFLASDCLSKVEFFSVVIYYGSSFGRPRCSLIFYSRRGGATGAPQVCHRCATGCATGVPPDHLVKTYASPRDSIC